MLSRQCVRLSVRPSWSTRQCSLRLTRLLHEPPTPVSQASSQPSSQDEKNIRDTKEWEQVLGVWSQFSKIPDQRLPTNIGDQVTLNGYLLKRRRQHASMLFADLQVRNFKPAVQLCSVLESPEASPEARAHARAHDRLATMRVYTPVSVTGTLDWITWPKDMDEAARTDLSLATRITVKPTTIQPLNEFPQNIIISRDANFPPATRHLQIRFSRLYDRLMVRDHVSLELRKALSNMGFAEIETPLLFKSTPEGAREFLVPTRTPGLAYALPQSPQQYKQLLMASGIQGYYQFARCFRDEDLRADRQPEFTQLDLEMSFATGEDVRRSVELLMAQLPTVLNSKFRIVEQDNGESFPVPNVPTGIQDGRREWAAVTPPFPRIPYQEAMSRFGSDKPDLRIPFEIRRVDQYLPSEFVGKITRIENSDPIVDAFRFRPLGSEGEHNQVGPGAEITSRSKMSLEERGLDVANIRDFTEQFLHGLHKTLHTRPHRVPVALIVDHRQPLMGLSSIGHEGVEALTSPPPGLEPPLGVLEDGDVLFFHARKNEPFEGGSTMLGQVRTLLYDAAVRARLLPRNRRLMFLWVDDFPMFTLNSDDGAGGGTTEPGQGGAAGFSATHHPFTAPRTDEDAQRLLTDPLGAVADHYDLVVNGVELGGGSRRIHVAAMQELVFRRVLRMTDGGVAQFAHLLKALRAGCPPHAGFALGFDRLAAVLTGTDSVRDVIAFPKSQRGEDPMVGSPSPATNEQLRPYHLMRWRTAKKWDKDGKETL